MSIEVKTVNKFGTNVVDRAVLSQVTEQILTRAQEKTVDLSKVDLSKFNRAELGVDLYSNNVALDTQRQIAIQNAGLNLDLSKVQASTAYLNSQAASNHYAGLNKNVELVSVSNETSSIDNLHKDKRGANANPFAGFAGSKNNDQEPKQERFGKVA